MHGQFVWYDLMTSDPAAAQRFYPTITGWKTQKWDKASPDMPYTMWTVDGAPIGGVTTLPPQQRAVGVPPYWMASVHVNNVDETARQAASFGGKVVHAPSDIPDMGRYAILQDPQGAAIAIYQSSGPTTGFDGNPKVGHFSWHELMTTDYKAAMDFYRKLFGWGKTSEFDMGPLGMYQMYGLKGKNFGGMYNRTAEMAQVPPFWLSYVFVPDVKKATEIATRNGAKVVNGPMEVPGGDWIVVLADPQGAAFALHQAQPKTPAKATAKATAKPAAVVKAKSKPKAKAKPKKKAKAKAKAKANAKKKAKAKSKPRAKARAKKKSRRR